MDQIQSNLPNNSLATPELLNAIQKLSGLHLEKKKGVNVTYAMRSSEGILEILNSLIEKYELNLFIVTEFSQSFAFQNAYYKELIKMTTYDGKEKKEWFEPLETPLIFEKSTVIVKIIGYGGEFQNTCNFETPVLNFRQNNMSQNQKAGTSKSYYTKYALESMFAIDGAKDDDHEEYRNASVEKLKKENETLKAKLAEKPTFAQKNYDGVINFLNAEKDLANIKAKFNGLQKTFISDADGLHKKAIDAFENKIKELENV